MIEKMKARHIGIVACSAEGAALCYRTICLEGKNVMGRHNHPEITMHTHPLSEYMNYIEKDDWGGIADLMISSANKLSKVGAEFAICPDNTIHQAFDLVIDNSQIPWLHIAEEVAGEAKRRGHRYLGILGTRFLMESSVYPPYGAAVQEAVNLPVFDYVTMINYVYSSVVKKRFHGFM